MTSIPVVFQFIAFDVVPLFAILMIANGCLTRTESDGQLSKLRLLTLTCLTMGFAYAVVSIFYALAPVQVLPVEAWSAIAGLVLFGGSIAVLRMWRITVNEPNSSVLKFVWLTAPYVAFLLAIPLYLFIQPILKLFPLSAS